VKSTSAKHTFDFFISFMADALDADSFDTAQESLPTLGLDPDLGGSVPGAIQSSSDLLASTGNAAENQSAGAADQQQEQKEQPPEQKQKQHEQPTPSEKPEQQPNPAAPPSQTVLPPIMPRAAAGDNTPLAAPAAADGRGSELRGARSGFCFLCLFFFCFFLDHCTSLPSTDIFLNNKSKSSLRTIMPVPSPPPSDVDVVHADPELVPTSKLELRGWIMYDFANSVYASVAVGVLLPILIVTLAEQRAGGPEPGVVELLGNPDADRSTPTVGFMGARVSPTSVTLYFVSISVIIQAIVFITSAWRIFFFFFLCFFFFF
jgi:hypothetical protein